IGGLRSTYLRERKKVTDSQRSGAAADDIYVPRLWYYERLRFLSDHTEVRKSLSTLPSTLPSTPAEASDAQPGPSSQEEVEEPSWSQEDLSQEEAVECGSQEERDESVVSIANAKFTRPSCSVSEFLLSMRGTLCVRTGHTRSELTRLDFVVGKFYLLLSNFVCRKIRWKMFDGAHTRSEFPTTRSDRTFSIGKSDHVYGA
ncbi:hypothetical protein AB205_0027920, partial [Aquarana catesbeiana]